MDLSDKSLRMKRVNAEHRTCKHWPVEKKIEVVTKWLALGNMRLVAELTGVSYGQIRNWKTSATWWAEIEAEIKATRRSSQDSKLSRIVDKSLEVIEDRLDNGDFVMNNKTGEVGRKPVSLRDASTAANSLMQRQAILEKQNLDSAHQEASKSIEDQLKLLAEEFSKFNSRHKSTAETISFREIEGEETTEGTDTE